MKNKYTPIIITIGYFLFTYILFLFGPLNWLGRNNIQMWIFLIFSNILLVMGYFVGVKTKNIDKRKIKISKKRYIKILNKIILLNLIVTVLNLFFYNNLIVIDLKQLFTRLILALSDSSSNYLDKFNNNGIPRWYTYSLTLISPIIWSSIPLGLYNFKILSLKYKIILLLGILFEILRWILLGTNKGVIDIIIIFIIIVFLKLFNNSKKIKLNSKNKISIVIALVFMIFGIQLFTNNISSRVKDNLSTISLITNHTPIDENSLFLKILPNNYHLPVVYITQYLSQGYQGLSYAFELSFKPMFGIGSSYFIIENIEQLTNIDIYSHTLQGRMAYTGWDPFVNWHTAYTSFANDFSFTGTMILMLFIGYFFGKFYMEIRKFNNQISLILFILMCLLIFYIPMNNQIFMSPFTFMTFWIFVFLRIFSSKNSKEKLNNEQNI